MGQDVFLSLMKRALMTVLMLSRACAEGGDHRGFERGPVPGTDPDRDRTLPQVVKLVVLLTIVFLGGAGRAGGGTRQPVLDNFPLVDALTAHGCQPYRTVSRSRLPGDQLGLAGGLPGHGRGGDHPGVQPPRAHRNDSRLRGVAISIPMFMPVFDAMTSMLLPRQPVYRRVADQKFLIGILIGLLFGIPVLGGGSGGELIDLQRGSTMAQLVDPLSTGESSVMSTLLTVMLITLFFMSGGFILMVDGYYHSYQLW